MPSLRPKHCPGISWTLYEPGILALGPEGPVFTGCEKEPTAHSYPGAVVFPGKRVAQCPLSGAAAFPTVRALAAPHQNNPNSSGPRHQMRVEVEKPQGWSASLELHFLRKNCMDSRLFSFPAPQPQDAAAFCGTTTSRRVFKARSHPARSTSRWVTMRMSCAFVALARTP